MRRSKRIEKRERRPETPDSVRNSVLSVVSLKTHALVLRRGLGRNGQDSPVSPVIFMLKRFWVSWNQQQPPTKRLYKKLKFRCTTNDRETTSATDRRKELDIDFTSKIENKTAASAKQEFAE